MWTSEGCRGRMQNVPQGGWGGWDVWMPGLHCGCSQNVLQDGGGLDFRILGSEATDNKIADTATGGGAVTRWTSDVCWGCRLATGGGEGCDLRITGCQYYPDNIARVQ